MLSSEPPEASKEIVTRFPGLRFSYYMCGIQMCSQLVMDDMKQPFHLMLQHLLAKGGVKGLVILSHILDP